MKTPARYCKLNLEISCPSYFQAALMKMKHNSGKRRRGRRRRRTRSFFRSIEFSRGGIGSKRFAPIVVANYSNTRSKRDHPLGVELAFLISTRIDLILRSNEEFVLHHRLPQDLSRQRIFKIFLPRCTLC